MSADQSGGIPGGPMAPPTEPNFAPQFEKKSSWPVIIGIIAIVLGSLGALGALVSAAGSLFMPSLLSNLAPEQQTGLEIMEQWKGWTMASTALSCGLGVLLLVESARPFVIRNREVGP